MRPPPSARLGGDAGDDEPVELRFSEHAAGVEASLRAAREALLDLRGPP